MILSPPQNLTQAASLWATGIGLLFLGIGLSGAVTSLEVPPAPAGPPPSLEANIEFFDPPPAAAPEAPAEAAPSSDLPEEPSWEVPAVIEVTPPLAPSEMEELLPVNEPVPQVAVRPAAPPAPAIRKSIPQSSPNPSRSPQGQPPTGNAIARSGETGQGSVKSTGNQKGRFPQPAYPAAARRAGFQGTVALTVQVNDAGFPTSVELSRSSGHASLDSAAKEGIRRRWRWPSGNARNFLVPIRFVLE